MIATKEEVNIFSKEIERIVREKRINHIEAIVHYCTNSGIEVESVVKLLSPDIKTRLTSEATDLHLILRTGNRLPI